MIKKYFSRYISGASLFLIILLVAIGVFSMMRVYNSRNSVDEVARIDVPLIERMTNIETHQLEQSINFERAIRSAEEIGKYSQAADNFVLADSLFRHLGGLVDDALTDAERQVKTGIEKATTDNQRIIMKDLLNALKKMQKDHLNYTRDALTVIDLLVKGQLHEAIDRVEDVEAKEEKFNKQAEALLVQLEKYTETIVRHIETDERTTLRLVVLFTCFFVMVSIVISFISGSKAQIPIDKLTEGAKRVSKGEKEVQVRPPSGLTSELTITFNEMVIKLQDAQEEIERHMDFSHRTAQDLKDPVSKLHQLIENLVPHAAGFDEKLNQSKKLAQHIETIATGFHEVNSLRQTLDAKKEVLSFEEILHDVERIISSEKEASNVIVTKWFAKCPSVKYPSSHLTAILTQLMMNSIKFSNPDRLLEIEIESYTEGGHVILEIRDNGIGFDSKISAMEVLEPFKQLHESAEGNGMGLYLVKMIVDHHHGHIEVKSKSGKGTIFTIYLN